MEKEELVSIIVPVYNVEKYLEKCLESIINQTYKNLEIICIDDGSPDNSIDILNKFSEKDPRIKIIRQKNRGLSGARNTGINISKGKYITFVDSDDWIENNMVELLVKKMEIEDLELVICGRNHIINGEVKAIKLDKIEKILMDRILSGKEYFLEIISKTNLFTASAYNKLYLLEKIKKENLIFPEGRLYEDLLFVFKYLYFSKKVNIVNKELYNYFINREGAITNKINTRDIIDINYTYKEIYNFLEEQQDLKYFYNKKTQEYLFIWMTRAILFKLLYLKNKMIKKNVMIELKTSKEYKTCCSFILKRSLNIKLKIFILILYWNDSILFHLLKCRSEFRKREKCKKR